MGVKAWRLLSGRAMAASTAAGIASASCCRMRCPALWPSAPVLRAACTMFSAQPKAWLSSASRTGAPPRATASAQATGQQGAGRSAASMATWASSGRRWLSQASIERPICSVCRRSSALSRVSRSQSLSSAMRAVSPRRQARIARAASARSPRAWASHNWSHSQAATPASPCTAPLSIAASSPSE